MSVAPQSPGTTPPHLPQHHGVPPPSGPQPPSPGGPQPPPSTRERILSLAGAVALLVVGALLGVLVPRLVDTVFPPKREIPNVAIIAHPSGHNGYTYFVRSPDWSRLAEEYEACSDSAQDLTPLYSSDQDCEEKVLARYGGIPVFGSASIDITNAQSASIQITEVRTVVERRTPTEFEAYFQPPVGGPIGTALGFNLDRDEFRARLMTANENVVPPMTDPPETSRPAYFEGYHS